jgi:hypothetical protein
MLDTMPPGQQKGINEMGIGFNKPESRQQQRQQKRDAYHESDKLNLAVHNYSGGGRNGLLLVGR